MASRLVRELSVGDVPSSSSISRGGTTNGDAPDQDGEDDRGARKRRGSERVDGEGNGVALAHGRLDEEEEREAVFYRLESLGYRVGQGLVERCV